jgi:hypothetical protein
VIVNEGVQASGFAAVKKRDKPETDYQHLIKVGIAIFAAITLMLTFVTFVARFFE